MMMDIRFTSKMEVGLYFSGTEPVLRVFAEMDKLEKAEEIAKVVEATLGL